MILGRVTSGPLKQARKNRVRPRPDHRRFMPAPKRGARPEKSVKNTLSLQSANWDQFGTFGIRSGSYKSHLFNQKTHSLGVRFEEVSFTDQQGRVIEVVDHSQYVKAGREARKEERLKRANAKARKAHLIKNKVIRNSVFQSTEFQDMEKPAKPVDCAKLVKRLGAKVDNVPCKDVVKAVNELSEAQRPFQSYTDILRCKIDRAAAGGASSKYK